MKINKLPGFRGILSLAMLLVTFSANAFWVVNFGIARTLLQGKISFAAGMGGQVVMLGNPKTTSAFFTIPHAGFRYGISDRLDIGLRLAPIPLPFATVGPGFGVNLDLKYCMTKPGKKFDFSLVAGFGGAHVLIEENTRYAISPNAALLGTYNINKTTQLTGMFRYVNLVIPSAPKGSSGNFVNIAGITLGLRKEIRPNISILPEIGVYSYSGQINGVVKNGPGFQYGLMIATSF